MEAVTALFPNPLSAVADMKSAVVAELPWSAPPEEVFAPLAERPFAQFLDSSQSDGAAGRWSILVSDPFAVLRLNAQDKPFDALRRGLNAYAVSPEWRERGQGAHQGRPYRMGGGAMVGLTSLSTWWRGDGALGPGGRCIALDGGWCCHDQCLGAMNHAPTKTLPL